MELLREIEEQAQTLEFRLFLEDVKSVVDDMGAKDVSKVVRAKMEFLSEMGRGDFGAHMGLASQAGVKGHETDPHVSRTLNKSNKFSLSPRTAIQPGMMVRVKGQTYRVPSDPKAFKANVTDKVIGLENPKSKSAFDKSGPTLRKPEGASWEELLQPLKSTSGQPVMIWIGDDSTIG